MYEFSTEGISILVIFCRETVAVLFHTSATTSPSESTNANTLYRHNPHASDDILAVVLVRRIDTFTVIHTYLIV